MIVFALSAQAGMFSLTIGNMLSGQITTGSSSIFGPNKAGRKTFQATVAGTGTVSATVQILVSDDVAATPSILLGTITLSGTTSATDGFASEGSWGYYMAKVTAISGTGATVAVISSAE